MRSMLAAAKLRGWKRIAGTVALVSVVSVVSLVAACGGGGGSSSNSGSSSSSGSGSSGSGSNGGSLPASPTQQPIAAGAANTVQVSVGQGLMNVINIPSVTVTVCAPGSATNCQTINNIQVDTGSYGLRIVSSVLTAAMNNALALATAPALPGAQLAECAIFADGYTWGTVRTASVSVGGETAASIPVHVIGDLPASTVPNSCAATGAPENTVSALGVNGILGIGVAPADCGTTCANTATAPTYSNYYACPGGSNCVRTAVPVAQQVANPVAHFALDNNGVILQMPPISNAGAASATGTLVFGIGTQPNNALPTTSQIFTTDGFGDLKNSTFNGASVSIFFDSGSNAYFFADSALPLCTSSALSDFYCPSTGQTLSVNLVGLNGAAATASLGIQNASSLLASGTNYAFNDLGGTIGAAGSFDIGLPFFYGRHMYYGLDQTASGGSKPFVAY